ncbi:Ser/Thr protein kinase RdoA (MazF antagonist) [Thermosporothrix hazakensis]|jgi:Ser/Thr protein kinase RdoA (MazF antagonist)|uniref:Ser/Thr protein kinase RdoA (MazF antagonist) n=1 Tax=Thermosporothrix hazakensis TaxID=644383 RepID=A0A326U6E8_THEHA|nr:phosphotransferase [Thermosporothrix hazakensis]PZW29541.1 Ser/Thr protein kinase RdoA (MazF antagonist) [Thermosporothrix hazakensis]GCE45745.1 aminoglycoside phosphotransferase [Thermosporothrix hazakensis]
MESIEKLPYNSRVRRLRELAEAALTHYDLGSARLSLLSQRSDTLFRVAATRRILLTPEVEEEEEEDIEEREVSYQIEKSRYVLRIYGPEALETPALLSELRWLTALRHDTELVVPSPVLSRNGSYIVNVAIEDIPETPRCALFHWVEGRFVDSRLTPGRLERVGLFMARLHQHAETYSPPASFTRPVWDWQQFFGPRTIYDREFLLQHYPDLLSVEDHATLIALVEKTEEVLHSLPQTRAYYGLIHGDFQQTNYLFYKDEVRAIDFEECQFGYYLYDIAVMLAGLAGRENEAALRLAFFNGYMQIRTLPDDYERLLQLFEALVLVRDMNRCLQQEPAPEKQGFAAAMQRLRACVEAGLHIVH